MQFLLKPQFIPIGNLKGKIPKGEIEFFLARFEASRVLEAVILLYQNGISDRKTEVFRCSPFIPCKPYVPNRQRRPLRC